MKVSNLLAVVVVAVLAASCSSNDRDKSDAATRDPSSTPATERTGSPTPTRATALPACADVWVKGQTLDPSYAGCTLADGEPYAGEAYSCVDGATLHAWEGPQAVGPDLYGITGMPIRSPRDEDAYYEDFELCAGP